MTSVDDALGGLARSAVIVFLGTVLGRLLSLVGQVLVARTLGPATFGHVALAYTVVLTAAGLALLGVHEGLTRQMAADDEPSARRRLLAGAYLLALAGAVVAVVALAVARDPIGAALDDPRLPALVLALAPVPLLHGLSRVSFGALRVHGRSLGAVVARDLGPRIGSIALFVALALAGLPVAGAVAYWISVPAITLVLASAYLHRELDLVATVAGGTDRETLRGLWSFSWPLALGSTFFILLSNVDVVMIGYFMDARAVGLYRAVSPLRQVTLFVLTAFSFLFLPLATEYHDGGDIAALDRLYTVSTKWIVAATVPPVLVFTLFATDVVRAFFGAAYVPAAPALAVLTGGLFVRALVGLNGDVAKAIDRPEIELRSVAVAVVVDVALNAILIPRYGIVGAAAATAAGYAVYNLVEVVAIHRAVGSHPFAAATLVPLGPTLAVAAGIDALVARPVGLSGLVGIGLVLVVVHLGSMALTGSLDESDRLLARRLDERLGTDLARLVAPFDRD